jgi:uncharacterized protein (TIGR02646 family)
MKKIEPYLGQIPANIQPTKLVEKKIIQNVLVTKRIDVKDYNQAGVKEQLLILYGHCCAFCEKTVDKYAPIEHFRPKHRITGVDNEGYYWLGVEWSNFLLACGVCNGQDNKGNHFPIAGTRAVAPVTVDFTDKSQNDSFFQQCNLFSASLQAEQPLLLHPVLDNPDDCLRFEKNGTVTPKNEKGRVSIEIYGLNDIEKRQDLIAARKKIVDKVKAEVNHCICNYRDNERLFQDLLRIREKLRVQAAGSQHNDPYNEPFSAVRRACVVHFETFFIDPFKQSDKYSQEDKDRLECVFKELEQFLREFDEYPL